MRTSSFLDSLYIFMLYSAAIKLNKEKKIGKKSSQTISINLNFLSRPDPSNSVGRKTLVTVLLPFQINIPGDGIQLSKSINHSNLRGRRVQLCEG